MKSTVYYWNLRASMKAPYDQRLRRMLKVAKVNEHLSSGDLAAVKVHFGEAGTTGHIQPLHMKPILDFLAKAGARPFLTDASTLYVGQRGEAVSHALVAARHGFDPNILGAPVIIADGLKGGDEVALPVKGKHVQEAYIASGIVEADFLVAVSHVKGHELAGFGGCLKNVGMGCASKKGKMQQHVTTGPALKSEHCVGCGACVKICAAGALSVVDEKAVIDLKKCVGCGACFLACRNAALTINWETDIKEFMERMMEYAAAVLLNRKKPSAHINFLTNIVPDCDCMGFTDAPICPDLGILLSMDPVAVDQASVDLINKAQPLYPSALPALLKAGDDKFLAMRPHMPRAMGLDYAESLGLGSREYKLVEV